MGDFNIDLLKYEKDHNTADFLDQMYSASLASLKPISDHLAQFLFLPIDQFKTINNKNIYQRNFKSFNQQILLEHIQNLNWKKKDVDYSFDNFVLVVETLLDTYAPIQTLTKAESKLKSKPWLTKGTMTSIKKKIKYTKKLSKLKTQLKRTFYVMNSSIIEI